MVYFPVLLLALIAIIVGVGALTVSSLFGPRLPNQMKNQPFECGVPPVGDAKQRFAVRFYLVAILFLLFDIETIFFIPFAIAFKGLLPLGLFILLELGVFVAALLVGYFYIIKKNALEWE